ncbi:MAG: hypothetical protein K9M44_03890 [Candidatus Pacebacteria bacterium]|nr:hypothetical protein [Candidatus Paceibacterota bacterium]
MNKSEAIANQGLEKEGGKKEQLKKPENKEGVKENLDMALESGENRMDAAVAESKKSGQELLNNSYSKILTDKLNQIRQEILNAEKHKNERLVLEKESELKKIESLVSVVEKKNEIDSEILKLKSNLKLLKKEIKTFEREGNEKKVLATEDSLRKEKTALETKSKEAENINLEIKDLDNYLNKNEKIGIKQVESAVAESDLKAENVKQKTHEALEKELEEFKNKLMELRAEVKLAEKKQYDAQVEVIETEIRETEKNIQNLQQKKEKVEEIEELNNKIKEIREEIKKAEKEQDEDKVLEPEEKLREVEKLKLKKTEQEENNTETGENKEKPQTEESKEGEKSEEIKIAPEALSIFSEFNIGADELKTVPNFSNLSEVAQILLARSFSANALERAQARSGEEMKKHITSKNSVVRFFQGLKAGLTKSAKIDKASSVEEKQAGLDKHLEELSNLSGLYNEAKFEGEVKGDKVEVSFANLADYNLEGLNPENQEKIKTTFDNFNKSANSLGEMPKYWQDKSAKPKDRERYEVALKTYKQNKAELALALSQIESLTRTSQLLNQAEYKVNMMQFLASNPDLDQEWKNMNKEGWQKLLSNFTKSDNVKFMGIGMATRAITSSLVGAAALPLVTASLGAIRGYKRGETAVRKKDEKKSKSQHIKDTQLFAKKDQVFQEIIKFNKENRDASGERTAIESIVNKCVSDSDFRAEAMRVEGVVSEKDKKNFVPSREADYVLEIYQNLNKPQNKLSEKEFQLLLSYANKVSNLKELNNKINEGQEKSIDKKTAKGSDLTDKLDGLIMKIKSSKPGEAEYEKNLDMLARRVQFSQDKAERDLINFGDTKERAFNQASFYEVMAKARFLLLENNHDASKEAYKQAEERANKWLDILEEKGDIKLSQNRRNFFVKKAIEGATMGVAFAAGGYGLMHGASAVYEGASDFISDISGSHDLPTEPELNEMTNMDSIDTDNIAQEYNLSPEEQSTLLEMPEVSHEELIEQIGELRAITHTIESGENFTTALRDIMENSSEHTQDAFIEKVNNSYNILAEEQTLTDANRAELLEKAINRLSTEGANPDSGVTNLVYKGNIVKVNSETGQWEITQGNSDFVPKAEELKNVAEDVPSVREEIKIEKMPSRPSTKIPEQDIQGAVVNKINQDGAEVINVDNVEGAEIHNVEDLDNDVEVISVDNGDGTEVEPLSDNVKGAEVHNVENLDNDVEVISVDNGDGTEVEPLNNNTENVENNLNIANDNEILDQLSGKATIKNFLANLTEEQRNNLSFDDKWELFKKYNSNLSQEEQASFYQGFKELVDNTAKEQFNVAQILSKSNNFSGQINYLKNIKFSDSKKQFMLDGQRTSFAEELNKVVGKEDFYENLSTEQKNAFERLIKYIQKQEVSSMGKRKASSAMRDFMKSVVE